MEAAGRSLDCGRQGRAEHDRIGAAGDRLGDVATLGHAAVGDDMDVDAGLVEVTHPGSGHIGDGRGLGDPDTEHAPGGAGIAGTDADEHADRTGAHEVETCLVRRTATDDDRNLELADEPLEVERLDRLGDMLGRDDRALDDQYVELGGQQGGGEHGGLLGGDRGGGGDAGRLHLLDALGDQVELHRLGVHLLHPGGGLLRRQFTDLVEERRRVLVAGPQALEVQYAESAEATNFDGGRRADHAVHGRSHEGEFELVGIDLPADVDIFGVAGATARDDGDVIEPVGPPSRFEDANF